MHWGNPLEGSFERASIQIFEPEDPDCEPQSHYMPPKEKGTQPQGNGLLNLAIA